MYLSILILPLLGSIVSGLLGRKIGVTGSHLITCTCLIISSIFSTIAFYEVGICNSPVSINLGLWVDTEIMSISWEFLFDQLTVSLELAVLYCSTLIHIYSTSYLHSDPHNQRFFSYLSLFTFFMLLLVSAGNYFVMFIGWEGKIECLKWYEINNLQYSVILIIQLKRYNTIKYKNLFSKLYFSWQNLYKEENKNLDKKLTSYQRIGPHNIDIISIIVGSTLGDTHLEKRTKGIGTRIIFEQSNKNVEYLMWFHSYLATRGYCNNKKPNLKKRLRKGKVIFHYRISSYTYSSFNWIHEMFYDSKIENGVKNIIKIIPLNIEKYLTPLALAIWFMDDGSKLGKGAKIATNCFTKKEVLFLCEVLDKKYNLKVSVNSGGKNKGYTLYISSKSMIIFSNLIKLYMLPSLYYKLGDY